MASTPLYKKRAFRGDRALQYLDDNGFNGAKLFMEAFEMVDDPAQRCALLLRFFEYIIPKPKAVEDDKDMSDNIKSDASYEMLKAMMTERLKNECQQNLLQQSSESQPVLSAPAQLTGQLKQN